jgi:hypothetical protein
MRLTATLVFALGISSMAAAEQCDLCVIPRPVSVETCEGAFTIAPRTTILVEPGHPELDRIGRWPADLRAVATGFRSLYETERNNATFHPSAGAIGDF